VQAPSAFVLKLVYLSNNCAIKVVKNINFENELQIKLKKFFLRQCFRRLTVVCLVLNSINICGRRVNILSCWQNSSYSKAALTEVIWKKNNTPAAYS
jgi:hypothetical protein